MKPPSPTPSTAIDTTANAMWYCSRALQMRDSATSKASAVSDTQNIPRALRSRNIPGMIRRRCGGVEIACARGASD